MTSAAPEESTGAGAGAAGAPGGRVIAIDGPAGSGKSTVAREVARRLGLDYLDTGAMYRSVAFAALKNGVDPEERGPVGRLAQQITIDVGEVVVVDGYDASIEIRGPEVTRAVSVVAANPDVRTEMRDRQRAWAAAHGGGVVEGRDIGTVVFPDAVLKVYLTASDEERARRRHQEATENRYDGDSPAMAVESVQADLARRDHLDSTRAVAPLAVAPDAVVIDTTGRSVDAIVGDVLARLDDADGRGGTGAEGSLPEGPPEAPAPDDGAWRPAEKSAAGAAFDRVLYKIVRALVYGFCKTFWRLRVEGLENLPATGPYLVAPVHRSNVDFALVSCLTTRRMRFMGKDSLWKHRALGRFISALGAFPVHRGSADREALRRCVEVLEDGEPLVMFPEGTRQSGPIVQELFDGTAYVATRENVPIVPVGIGGSERAMPVGSKLLRPTRIAIVIGEAIHPEVAEGGKRTSRRAVKELTERLHHEVQVVFDAAQVRAGA